MRMLLGESADYFAYPFGKWSELSEVILAEEGVSITFGTQPHVNTLIKGLPQSLRVLGRLAATEEMSGEALLSLLENAQNISGN